MTPELTKLVRPPTYVQNVYGDAKSWQAWTPYGRFIYGVDFAGKFYTQTPEGETDHPSLKAAEDFAHKSYAARVIAALDAELLTELVGALRAALLWTDSEYDVSAWRDDAEHVLTKLGVQP